MEKILQIGETERRLKANNENTRTKSINVLLAVHLITVTFLLFLQTAVKYTVIR